MTATVYYHYIYQQLLLLHIVCHSPDALLVGVQGPARQYALVVSRTGDVAEQCLVLVIVIRVRVVLYQRDVGVY